MQSIPVFPDMKKLLIFGEKMLMSAEPKECVTWFSLGRYNCVKLHQIRKCVTDFSERGGGFLTPIREQPQKGPSWIGLKVVPNTLRKQPPRGVQMADGKSLSANMVKFLEKACEKRYTLAYFHSICCIFFYFCYQTVSHTEQRCI